LLHAFSVGRVQCGRGRTFLTLRRRTRADLADTIAAGRRLGAPENRPPQAPRRKPRLAKTGPG
jgi:hypothetical protein